MLEVSNERANVLVASGQAVAVDDRKDRGIVNRLTEDLDESSDEDDKRDRTLDKAAGEDEPSTASRNGQESEKKYGLDATSKFD